MRESGFAKVIGFVLVALAATVKLPQILKIIHSSSGEGISLIGTILELLATLAIIAYNYGHKYPFSAYGEAVFISAQQGLIISLILFFSGQTILAAIFVAFYSIAIYFLTISSNRLLLG